MNGEPFFFFPVQLLGNISSENLARTKINLTKKELTNLVLLFERDAIL